MAADEEHQQAVREGSKAMPQLPLIYASDAEAVRRFEEDDSSLQSYMDAPPFADPSL
jgi:hypothetical protein